MTTSHSRIPQFKSIQEEAEFWDKHDFTDYLDEMKLVEVKFAKNLSQGITVRFDSQTLHHLKEKAAEKGIGATSLIRMWVLERLQQTNKNAYE